ncbi:MAG: hypothetical protein QNK23_16275 [Crocinitomicaceae bacterium]|nr:hypothetical protein [Crocinitomicaceae bacterium]
MKKKEVKEYQRRKQMSWSNIFYSNQRLDLLVIAISGAGIYACLEVLKFIAEEKTEAPTALLKIVGAVMIFAIISNFISQILGLKANNYDYLMSDQAGKDNCKFNEYDKKADQFTKYVGVMNWLSYISMFSGLIVLITFFAIYF